MDRSCDISKLPNQMATKVFLVYTTGSVYPVFRKTVFYVDILLIYNTVCDNTIVPVDI
jgi:hypothetical protein